MNQHFGHSHSHGTEKVSDRLLLGTVFINLGLSVFEFIAGLIAGSTALMADALHNTNDAAALLVAYVARRVSRKGGRSQVHFRLPPGRVDRGDDPIDRSDRGGALSALRGCSPFHRAGARAGGLDDGGGGGRPGRGHRHRMAPMVDVAGQSQRESRLFPQSYGRGGLGGCFARRRGGALARLVLDRSPADPRDLGLHSVYVFRHAPAHLLHSDGRRPPPISISTR